MKRLKALFFLIVMVGLTYAPVALAADPLVPCGNPAQENGQGIIEYSASTSNDCDLEDVFKLIDNLITFCIITGALVTVGLFAHTGFLYLTAGAKTGQLQAAKKRFAVIGIGFLLMIGAWLIFKTITVVLLNTNGGYTNPLD